MLNGDPAKPIVFDQDEFYTVDWFQVGQLPLERSEPHLNRFKDKLLDQMN